MIIPVLKLDTTITEQVEKVREECTEVLDAFDNKESIQRKLEEMFDLVQSLVRLFELVGTEKEIMKANRCHNIKMATRGHEIIKVLEVKEKC